MLKLKDLQSWILSEEILPKSSKLVAGASYSEQENGIVILKRNIVINLERYADNNPYREVFNYQQSKDWEVQLAIVNIFIETLNEKFEVDLESTELSGYSDEDVIFIHSGNVAGAIRVQKVLNEQHQWRVDILIHYK